MPEGIVADSTKNVGMIMGIAKEAWLAALIIGVIIIIIEHSTKFFLGKRKYVWGSYASYSTTIPNYPLGSYLTDVEELGKLARTSLLATCVNPPSWFNDNHRREALNSINQVPCHDKRRLIILRDLKQIEQEIGNGKALDFNEKYGELATSIPHPVKNFWTTRDCLEKLGKKFYLNAASEDLIIIDNALVFGYKFGVKKLGIKYRKSGFLISAESEFISGIKTALSNFTADDKFIFNTIEKLRDELGKK